MVKGKNRVKFSKILAKARPFVKPFIIVLVIYAVAISSIVRANYNYMDDAGRAIDGYAWTSDFNRVSSSLFGFALNVNLKLSDISPLPQIMAIILLSASSVILTYVFCNKKIKYLPLIASSFIGLCPFMYGCWVFKFDAPCMALSLFISTIPLLFWNTLEHASTRYKIIIFLLAVLCMLIMWTSYQASSGVIIVFVLGLAMIDILRGCSAEMLLKKVAFYALAYLSSAMSFKLLFPDANGGAYRETEVFSLNELLSGIVGNIGGMLDAVASSVNIYWLILVSLVIICFIVSAVNFGIEHSTIARTLVAVFLLPLPMFILSYGAYLVLRDAPTLGRSLVGVGAFMAVVAMCACILAEGWLAIVAGVSNIILIYAFIVYGLAFGNGLSSQKDYADFRIQQLVNELVNSRVDISSGDTSLKLIGDIGPSPVMQHVIELYPVTNRIFYLQSGLNDKSYWGYRQLIDYYGANVAANETGEVHCNSRLSSSRYYDIDKDTDGNVCVTIK